MNSAFSVPKGAGSEEGGHSTALTAVQCGTHPVTCHNTTLLAIM